MTGFENTQYLDLYHPTAHPDTRPMLLRVPAHGLHVDLTLHSLFLYSELPLPCHPPSCWLRLFLSQTLSHVNNPTFLNPSHSSYLPVFEDRTDRAFQNVGIYNSDARELPRGNHTRKYIFVLNVPCVLGLGRSGRCCTVSFAANFSC